jgi:hypothetical protein
MAQSRKLAATVHGPTSSPTVVRPRPTPSPGAAMQSRLGATGTRIALEGQAKQKTVAGKQGAKGQAANEVAAKGSGGKTAVLAAAAQVEATAGKVGPANGVPMHMPEPPDQPSPDSMKRLAATQSRAGDNAGAQASLPDAEAQADAARKSVVTPEAERAAKAEQDLIAEMHAAPSPEIEKLCEKIRKDIYEKRPPDEDAVVKGEPDKAAMQAGNGLNANIKSSAQEVQQNYSTINTPPATPAAAAAPGLAPQPNATPAASINAGAAAPSPVPAENLSLDKDASGSKTKMDKAGMDKDPAKLVKSGPIAEAREAQGELEQTAKEDPALIRAKQKETLATAKADMAELGASALAALRASRQSAVGRTEAGQKAMVGSEEQQRAAVSKQAQQIFETARTTVEALIKGLPEKSMAEWDAAKTVHSEKFKNKIKVAQAKITERYSGLGRLHVIGDTVFGLPSDITEIYTDAEKAFGDDVIKTITDISTKVNAIILACEKIIADAKAKIKGIFDKLPQSLQSWAAGEQEKFAKQLDKLQDQAHATRDNFNKGLVEQASQAVNEVRAEIAEMRKKAGGLLGRITDAVNRFLDDPAKFIIEGLLELLGIPPAAFWAVVAKIKKCIKDIADDPMNFANNLMKGLGQGFSQFFDNFGTHMLKGFITWLVGDLKGVQLPKDLSPKSIATFFLQLMGITWPNIRAILSKKVGEKNIALIEKAWSLISLLMEKGPEGIYDMIKERLDPQTIIDQVIEMAVDYMVTAIAKNVAARLLLLFNPAGAIVQALEAIYRVLKWVFQNAARIFRLVETVVNGIANIIAGNIGGFATAVENALAMLIPPVIGFIADYFNMGDLPKVIAAQVKKMQTWVLGHIEKAVDWVIAKGKGLLSAVGLGGKKGEEGKKDGSNEEIGKKISWSSDGEAHQLWIRETTTSIEVMMASDDPGPVRTKLNQYDAKAAKLKGPGSKDRKSRANKAISQARGILDSLTNAAKATKAASKKPNATSTDIKAKDNETESWEDKLWPQLQTIQIALQMIPLPITVKKGIGGSIASTVTAEPLTKKGTGGSRPVQDPIGWEHVEEMDWASLNPKTAQFGPKYWVRGHLLSMWLHGEGVASNLVPLQKTHNGDMERRIERPAWIKTLEDEVLYYEASVDFHSKPVPRGFPSSIRINWGTMRLIDGQWQRAEHLPAYSISPKPPPLQGDYAPTINDAARSYFTRVVKTDPSFALAITIDRFNNGDLTASNARLRLLKFDPAAQNIGKLLNAIQNGLLTW